MLSNSLSHRGEQPNPSTNTQGEPHHRFDSPEQVLAWSVSRARGRTTFSEAGGALDHRFVAVMATPLASRGVDAGASRREDSVPGPFSWSAAELGGARRWERHEAASLLEVCFVLLTSDREPVAELGREQRGERDAPGAAAPGGRPRRAASNRETSFVERTTGRREGRRGRGKCTHRPTEIASTSP